MGWCVHRIRPLIGVGIDTRYLPTVQPTPGTRHLIERLKAHDFVLAQNPTHIGLRTSGQLVAALERNGFKIDRVGWTPSFFPVLRTVERLIGRFSQTFRYRLCIRASS